MAWETPKTNWKVGDTPSSGDFNRVEENTDDLNTRVSTNKTDIAKKFDKIGGTFTGITKAQNNASYTTGQIRNITLSTGNASGGSHGDIWIKYK